MPKQYLCRNENDLFSLLDALGSEVATEDLDIELILCFDLASMDQDRLSQAFSDIRDAGLEVRFE